MTTAETPDFPGTRAARCPFDPPPVIQDLQEQTPLARVRLPNGGTPWLVTRYEDQKTLLADPRVSSDPRRPGYPSPLADGGMMAEEGAPISFTGNPPWRPGRKRIPAEQGKDGVSPPGRKTVP